MRISDFDYELPEELIAQHPLAERDASRMLVVNRADGSLRNDHFLSFPNYLHPGDCLVLNNTRVFAARLTGKRLPGGGSVEVLLLREVEPGMWQVLARPARRLRIGTKLSFGNATLEALVKCVNDDATRTIQFNQRDNLQDVFERIGHTPLPPYIKRDSVNAQDRERYQTVYAREVGAIAAPTAGLHFTPRILQEVTRAGVRIAEITLHVGYGTFEPVRVDDVSQHRVIAEAFEISKNAAELITESQASGGRVVAIGTTTTRALESAVSENGKVAAKVGMAGVTITPGYRFQVVNVLLTNFHLPRSSLLLLVSAFAGRDSILQAYRHAVHERYRFYSYGDCMLIL